MIIGLLILSKECAQNTENTPVCIKHTWSFLGTCSHVWAFWWFSLMVYTFLRENALLGIGIFSSVFSLWTKNHFNFFTFVHRWSTFSLVSMRLQWLLCLLQDDDTWAPFYKLYFCISIRYKHFSFDKHVLYTHFQCIPKVYA